LWWLCLACAEDGKKRSKKDDGFDSFFFPL
jgi:hypothetical protein